MTPSALQSTKDQLFRFYILMPFVMLLGVGVIYLPFGFGQIGLIEEWGLLGIYTEHGPLYWITKNTPLSWHRMRPLVTFPFCLGYQLDTNSFFYWNIILFLSIWLKGVGMGFIIWWLYPQRWAAFLGGLLLILYPADTMQLLHRAMHIDGAVAFTLCAIAILLWATQKKESWVRLVMAFSAGALFLFGCLMYESTLILAPLPLLLWWLKYGFSTGLKMLKSQSLLIFFWLAAIVLEASYIFWVIRDPDTYQNSFNYGLQNFWDIIWQNSPMLFTVGMYRSFLHSWYDAGHMLFSGGSWVSFLPAAVFLILSFVVYLCMKNLSTDAKDTRVDKWFFTRWLIASFLITVIGYSPYIASYSHLLITQRTYLFAAVGGALFFTGLIIVLRKHFRFLGAGMAGALLLLGISAQWTQFAHYEAIAAQQKAILSGILEAAPQLDSKQTLFLIDRSGRLGNTWMLRGELLKSALTYLYGKKTEVVICMEPGQIWSSFVIDNFMRTGQCIEQPNAWQIGQGTPGAFSLPKEHLITLVLEADGHIYRNPKNAEISSATQNEQTRWKKILGCWPAKSCLAEVQSPPYPDHFAFNFGEWWSLEEPIPGVGWQDTQWIIPAWNPRSFAWINQPQSTLHFQLTPKPVPYVMQLGFANMVSETAKESLKVFLNGYPLQHHWQDAMHAQAKIDPAWLKEGMNEILFHTEVKPDQGVSLGVEYVKVVPQAQEN